MCVLAGAYIFNDYCDQGIDEINRLDKNIFINNTIKPKTALKLSWIFTGIAWAISLTTAILNLSYCAFIFIFISTFLTYACTVRAKRIFMLKNLIITSAPLIAIFMPLIDEYMFLLRDNLTEKYPDEIRIVFHIFLWFALFFTLVKLIRVIVRDMQDEEGDRAFKVQSLIVRCGVKTTKRTVYVLTSILMAAVIAFQITYFHINPLSIGGGITILVLAPLIYFLIEFKKASVVQDYAFLADLVNIIFISFIFVTFFTRSILVCGAIV
jgi:4-hydroxybenzoate polyprenyltransferase